MRTYPIQTLKKKRICLKKDKLKCAKTFFSHVRLKESPTTPRESPATLKSLCVFYRLDEGDVNLRIRYATNHNTFVIFPK